MKSPCLAFLGLLALVGCQDASEPTSSSQEAGQVAFRLQAAELSVLRPTSDSIRVEAERKGYLTLSAVGAIQDPVVLDGLVPGAWTIRVASFDLAHEIHWYGDTSAQIRPGLKTDVVVRLRKATGSAVIRIILDSGLVDTTVIPGPRQDTLWNPVDSGRVTKSPVPVSLAGASRVGPYVFVRTPYNCGAPSPRLARWVDTAGTVHLTLYNKGPLLKIACTMEYREQVLVYKPLGPFEDVVVEDLQGKVVRLPGVVIEPMPPRFVYLDYATGGGFTANASSYRVTLDSMGVLVVLHSQTFWTVPVTRQDSMLVDPAPVVRIDTTRRILSFVELQTVKEAFSEGEMAYPDTLLPPKYACADAPWWKASVGYAGGHVATFWKPEEICSGLPSAYERLNTLVWNLINPQVALPLPYIVPSDTFFVSPALPLPLVVTTD